MTDAPSIIPPSGLDLASLRASFQLHLRAENKSQKTLETYTEALDQLIAFLEHAGRKGGWRQSLSILAKTARDLDRYLRKRTAHPHAALDDLWLGSRGALQANSILQKLKGLEPRAPTSFAGRAGLHIRRIPTAALHDRTRSPVQSRATRDPGCGATGD